MLTALVSRFPPEHIQSIIKRVGKLTPSQIDEYFDTHLPYRIRILLAHYRMTRESWTGDPGRLDACFVAALVTARLFLNLLGIGKDKTGAKLSRYRPHPDDVTADDLGGLLIDPATLPAHEQQLFLDFLRMADKAAAHFTVPITQDWSRTHDVVLGVHHHLKLCLYDHTSRTLRDATP
jgi:hypothetical protein